MRDALGTTTTDPAAGAAVRSVLLDRPGAVEGDGPDAGVAAHYGDPLREQRLITEGLAVVDLSHRGVVTVTGADGTTRTMSLPVRAGDAFTVDLRPSR